MSDLEITSAVRPILASGRALDLIEELLDSGNYTAADLVRVRSALARTAARVLGAGKAWMVVSDRTGKAHLWGCPTDEKYQTFFRPACGLIKHCYGGPDIRTWEARGLVRGHQRMLTNEHRGGMEPDRCAACEKKENQFTASTIAEVYFAAGKSLAEPGASR